MKSSFGEAESRMDSPDRAGLRFDWYGLVTDPTSFEQGDIFDEFPVVLTPADLLRGAKHVDDLQVESHRLILMTHSCDLAGMLDEEMVLLCDLSSFESAYDKETDAKKKDKWTALRTGRMVHSHLLQKCTLPEHQFGYQIVLLNVAFTVPFAVLKEFAGNKSSRIRLLPPYREHLSQAFARQFMRIGLPIDLPKDPP